LSSGNDELLSFMGQAMNPKFQPSKIFDHILSGLLFIAGLCFVFIITSVCIDVIIRELFNAPIQWVFEVAEYLLLVITFFSAAWVLRDEGHVDMDILTNRFPTRVQYLLKMITSAMGIFLCAVLSYFSAVCSLDLYKRGIYYPTLLEMPKAPVIGILVLGFFLLFIQFIRRARKYYYLWKKCIPKEEQERWIDRMR